jgi:hypothetical protein
MRLEGCFMSIAMMRAYLFTADAPLRSLLSSLTRVSLCRQARRSRLCNINLRRPRISHSTRNIPATKYMSTRMSRSLAVILLVEECTRKNKRWRDHTWTSLLLTYSRQGRGALLWPA